LREVTPKAISHGKVRKWILKFIEIIGTNTGEMSSSVSFHQYFHHMSFSFELQSLFTTFGVVRNDFF